MSGYLTPEELTAADQLEEADVPLRNGMVRVRGLTRQEVIGTRRATDMELANFDGPRVLLLERKMVAMALVEPKMTEAQVQTWQGSSPAGELEPVVAKIQELSAMDTGAEKRQVQTFRNGPGD